MDGLTKHKNVVRVWRVSDVDLSCLGHKCSTEELCNNVNDGEVECEQWQVEVGGEHAPVDQEERYSVLTYVRVLWVSEVQHPYKDLVFRIGVCKVLVEFPIGLARVVREVKTLSPVYFRQLIG